MSEIEGISPWFDKMLDYWDTTAPLVSIYEAWDGPDTPARVARDVRLRTLAAEQVAESRAERLAEP
jgi:hypothetical protein